MADAKFDELFSAMTEAARLFRRIAGEKASSGDYAAQAIEERRQSLISHLADGDPIEIATRLLDIVPNAKDLDAIGIDLAKHVGLAELLDQIDTHAAEISFDYLAD